MAIGGGRRQVGHNMLLDLAHLEAAFGQGSLPPDFDAFAAQAQDPHTAQAAHCQPCTPICPANSHRFRILAISVHVYHYVCAAA